MKAEIVFLVTTQNLQEAAAVESALSKANIPYEMEIKQGTITNGKKQRKKIYPTKEEVLAIEAWAAEHYNPEKHDYDTLAKKFNVGYATIGRIMNGTHRFSTTSFR